jgi:hypothetical protein
MKLLLLSSTCRWVILGLAFSFLGLNMAAAQSLELVCENTGAAQTNFQKDYFDSYGAATDSSNSRFTIDFDDNVFHYYPANSSSVKSKSDFKIIKKSFHNLTGNQAFLDGVGITEKYIKSITFHRNKSRQWGVQVTNSGNNEDSLFHRMYFYECVSTTDRIN